MSATIASSYIQEIEKNSKPPISSINNNRILSNGFVGFFTALLPLIAISGFTESAFIYAIMGATIQGGLAAAQEYKKEADKNSEYPPNFGLIL